MGYIDEVFKIKSAKAMEKHITKITAIEVMCIKMADVVRVIWAVDNKLHHYDIKGSVIYIIKEDALQLAVQTVLDSVKPVIKELPDSMANFFKKMGMDENWVEVEDAVEIRRRIYEDKLVPFDSSNSLHISEDRYIIDGATYRLLYAIGYEGEPDVERLNN
jgi:hypothetical protein